MKRIPWWRRPAILHPMAGCDWKRFCREYRENRPYTLRSLPSRLCAAAVVLYRAPMMNYERRRHDEAIRAHVLSAPPVFIIGHWRSGTTHLHNLLSLDPRFAFMTFFQTAMPLDCFGERKIQRALLRAFLPRTRGIDNVEINIDVPQEEEMALQRFSEMSFYRTIYFPRRLLHYFRQSILSQAVTEAQVEEFKAAYAYLVRKISYAHGGKKQILFKNPASTARMPLLLELFPDARFVHIVRHPHEVFLSMQRLWQRLVPVFSWQNYDGLDFGEYTLTIYEEMMRRYLRDRESVPPGQLTEVRYEDLDRAPAETVASIYRGVGLPDGDAAAARVAEHCAQAAPYRKNRHPEDQDLRRRVAERWRFAFDAWGYEA